MVELYLVRHGESENSDAPLNPNGLANVQRAASFAARLGVTVTEIRHSEHVAADQTAQEFAKALSSQARQVAGIGHQPASAGSRGPCRELDGHRPASLFEPACGSASGPGREHARRGIPSRRAHSTRPQGRRPVEPAAGDAARRNALISIRHPGNISPPHLTSPRRGEEHADAWFPRLDAECWMPDAELLLRHPNPQMPVVETGDDPGLLAHDLYARALLSAGSPQRPRASFRDVPERHGVVHRHAR